MKFTEFIQKQFSEPDGTPSNNRVMLFLLLTTLAGILIGVAISPNLSIKIVVPEVNESFSSLIKWLAGILVTGAAAGRAASAYSDIRSGNTTASTTQTSTTTETKG